jgi:hypothetical protein
MLDQRGQLRRSASPGSSSVLRPRLAALWSIVVRPLSAWRIRADLQLTRYDEKGWRATVTTGKFTDERDGYSVEALRWGRRLTTRSEHSMNYSVGSGIYSVFGH